MTYTTAEEFTVLHSVRVKGMTQAEAVAAATGLQQREVQFILDDAVARGLARSRTGGRVEGYMLTAPGRERHLALREQQVSESDVEALTPAYEEFLPPNRAFKEVTTRWQTSDASLDDVLAELDQITAAAGGVIAIGSTTAPWLRRYQYRLDGALGAFRAGDRDALAKPMTGSYHDVWMELHEDLLVTLGRERTDDDE